MKSKVLSLVTIFVLGSMVVFAKDKSEKFLVNGKCEMCEKRIEMAALSVKGVSKANWSKETKEIDVAFDETKTSVQKINEAVALVGHDTKTVKAPDEVYNKLPDCCKYDRDDLKTPEKAVKHKHK